MSDPLAVWRPFASVFLEEQVLEEERQIRYLDAMQALLQNYIVGWSWSEQGAQWVLDVLRDERRRRRVRERQLAHLLRQLRACDPPFFPGKGFRNHESHSAHIARYYYLTERGAYTTLRGCKTARPGAPPWQRVSTATEAGYEWWKYCRATHVQCQARNAHREHAPALIGWRAVYPTPPNLDATVSDINSRPFFFVVRETGSIYFEVRDAHADTRRSGATEVRVVRSLEEAVKTIAGRPPSAAYRIYHKMAAPDPSTKDLPASMTLNAQGRELKQQALDNVRTDTPHSEELEGWLDTVRRASGVSRSEDESEHWLKALKARVVARKQRECSVSRWFSADSASEGVAECDTEKENVPPPRVSAADREKRRAQLVAHVVARKQRVDRLLQLRNAPKRGPRYPPTRVPMGQPSTRQDSAAREMKRDCAARKQPAQRAEAGPQIPPARVPVGEPLTRQDSPERETKREQRRRAEARIQQARASLFVTFAATRGTHEARRLMKMAVALLDGALQPYRRRERVRPAKTRFVVVHHEEATCKRDGVVFEVLPEPQRKLARKSRDKDELGQLLKGADDVGELTQGPLPIALFGEMKARKFESNDVGMLEEGEGDRLTCLHLPIRVQELDISDGPRRDKLNEVSSGGLYMSEEGATVEMAKGDFGDTSLDVEKFIDGVVDGGVKCEYTQRGTAPPHQSFAVNGDGDELMVVLMAQKTENADLKNGLGDVARKLRTSRHLGDVVLAAKMENFEEHVGGNIWRHDDDAERGPGHAQEIPWTIQLMSHVVTCRKFGCGAAEQSPPWTESANIIMLLSSFPPLNYPRENAKPPRPRRYGLRTSHQPPRGSDGFRPCKIPFVPSKDFSNHKYHSWSTRGTYFIFECYENYGFPEIRLYTDETMAVEALHKKYHDLGYRASAVIKENIDSVNEWLHQHCRTKCPYHGPWQPVPGDDFEDGLTDADIYGKHVNTATMTQALIDASNTPNEADNEADELDFLSAPNKS
ncbi:hypothetical protein B0H11DRAFT_1928506 [Mycena galericulata]|nr:hypothetical protein B0H11DRAFT_1928506 [Mycena galericulata]